MSQVIRDLPVKDPAGDRLIKLLSVPRNHTKADKSHRRTPATDPSLFSEMYAYCLQDIKAESALSDTCPEMSPAELEVWLLDQEINTRGVAIDTEALNACIALVEQVRARDTAELRALTGGVVRTADELAKIQGWLAGRGLKMQSVDKAHIAEALKRDDLPHDVRRVLQIRKSLGARSIKKLYSIRNRICSDGRIRDLFAYCGADRTGRFAGRGPQPQNLPNSGPKTIHCPHCNRPHGDGAHGHTGAPEDWGPECVDVALADIMTRDLARVEYYWGDVIAVVAGCLRGLFVASPGNELICSDYSAIEAVVLAAVAKEPWRMDVFNTHGKIYETSASKITGVPLDTLLDYPKLNAGAKHPHRKLGKVAELASGYGGWIGAWKAFGADKFMSEQEIKKNILAWREESPNIVELWGGQCRKRDGAWAFDPELYGIEGSVVMALLNPGKCFSYAGITYGHSPVDDVLYCVLPSGRRLNYHRPRLYQTYDDIRKVDKYDISYMGHNSDYKKGPTGWMKLYTYSGKLVENIIQAIARDILTHAMLKLNAAGYPLVLHVHDEIVAEVPEGTGHVPLFEEIMASMPVWCATWPVRAAGGWVGKRYRK